MFSPSLRDRVGDDLAHGLAGLLDEGLLEQADLGEELLDLAVDDLLDDLRRLAGLRRLRARRSRARARPRRREPPRGARSAGCAAATCMARLAHELLEVVGAGDEVGLAVDLDQHADLAAGVDVRADDAFGRRRGRPSWPPRRAPSRAGTERPSRGRRRSRSSAFLQSMKPAPVFSRSSLTCCALTSLIRYRPQPTPRSPVASSLSCSAPRRPRPRRRPAALALLARARGPRSRRRRWRRRTAGSRESRRRCRGSCSR